MRQSRFSVEADAGRPRHHAASRPGLRLRVTGLVVVALFALLGLRLWALQVLQAPAAAQAVVGQPDPGRPGRPHPGPHPRPLRQPAGRQPGDRADHPGPGGRPTGPGGGGTAGRPHRPDRRRRCEATIADTRYSLYKPVPVLSDAPLSDILYIKEHQDEFPGVYRRCHHPAQLPPAGAARPGPGGYPAAQILGYVGTINTAELQVRRGPGVPGRRRLRAVRPRVPVRVASCGASPGSSSWRWTPRARWPATLKTDSGHAGRQHRHQHRHQPPAGGRQRPGHPDPEPAQDLSTPSATTTPAATRPPPAAR